jgi:hypothetical protein
VKYLAVILSLYVIFLCSLQCQDKIEVNCSFTDCSHTESQHNEKDCHSCSPLCVCNCCHTNTLVIVKKAIEPVQKIENAYQIVLSDGRPTEIPQKIWQPPKIVS